MPESTKPGKPATVGAVLVAVETLLAKALEPYLRLLREVIHLLNEVLRNEELRPLFFAIHELATGDERLRKYRQRWEFEGIAMTVAEAEYELICSVIASFNEQVDPAEHLLHVVGKDPGEGEIQRYIKCAESKALYWDALAAYKGSRSDGDVPSLLSDWPSTSAQRPSGRGRPPRWIFRNEVLIPEAIRKLEGCGMPVTSKDGPSISAAVAAVFKVSESTVADAWRDAPNRTRHSRERTVPCVRCGTSIPKFLADRHRSLCTKCRPVGVLGYATLQL